MIIIFSLCRCYFSSNTGWRDGFVGGGVDGGRFAGKHKRFLRKFGRMVVLRGGFNVFEELHKAVPKLGAHGAVDEEVHGVAEKDAQVHHNSHHLGLLLVLQQSQLQRIFEHEKDEEDATGQLHHQEDRHHQHQHQRGSVHLSEASALAHSVHLQKTSPSRLSLPHGPQQKGVNEDENETRQNVDKQDAKAVIKAEVVVLDRHQRLCHGIFTTEKLLFE